MNVSDVIKSRYSARAFLDKAVDQTTIEALLDIARWAPSGGNLQPWHVMVVTGNTKQRISQKIIQARASGEKERPDFAHYPSEWFEPYKSRRVASGVALYQALNIKRDELDKRNKAWDSNFRFFDAPAGLLFFIDRNLGRGAWVDLGMFVQSVMLAATERGLATCPQASLADYPDIIRELLAIEDRYALICGLSLGYPNPDAPENNYRTERAEVTEFTKWFS